MATKKNAPAAVLDELHDRLANLATQATDIQNVADNEKRRLNEEEVKNLKSIETEFASVEEEIKVRKANASMSERLSVPDARRAAPPDLQVDAEVREEAPRVSARPARSITGGEPAGVKPGAQGFRSMGEFAISAFRTQHGKPDTRIVNAPSTFGQEAVGSDGGFAVPPDFRQEIMKQVFSEDSLLSRCDQQTTSSNSITLPLDKTSPWQTSGGVLGNWMGEGNTITGSKPQLAQLEVKANKLGALVPVTDELLEDVASLTRWLQTKVPEKFTSLINDAIVNGDGIMKPLGILNSGALITQAAESGQGAGTVVTKNITNMWSRMYGPNRKNAVWLINQDVEPQLQVLVVPGTSPAFPAYMPPGGLSAQPYATLLGRPILPLEACATVGTVGDIILFDPTQYLAVLKAGGIRSDVSIHLYFDSDHTAFRFVMRVGGQPYWNAAIARAHGSNTLSPMIALNSSRT